MFYFCKRDLEPRRLLVQGCLLLTLIVVTGCTPGWYEPRLYHWDAYEHALRSQALDPAAFDQAKAVQELSTALMQADPRFVPPGMCLHLAFLMAQSGLDTEARAMIRKEGELFPESAVWTKRLLKSLNQKS